MTEALPTTVPDAVVFDLDGVLLDTTEAMRCAFSSVWHAAGRTAPLPFDEFLGQMGAPLTAILGSFGLSSAYVPVYEAASTARQDLVRPYDGMTDILHAVRAAGIPTAVATGKTRQRALEALRTGGLVELLDTVVGSDQVERPKPDPEILHTALHRLLGRHIPPQRAVFVGDSVLDMRCGRAAGVPTIAVGWGQTPPAVLLGERPSAFVTSPADLLPLLAVRSVQEVSLD
ncbi:HAD-IA family hydrolase [Streptomyces canus]|uniref:HAD family hydrolase n=1 Tax=Streptomyces canus TaxID=58343 RepID=UPI0030DE0602